jgi:hypothetical protein
MPASCENASSETFHSRPGGKDETCANILSKYRIKHFASKKKTFCIEHSRLRYFTIICNADEYKKMELD